MRIVPGTYDIYFDYKSNLIWNELGYGIVRVKPEDKFMMHLLD